MNDLQLFRIAVQMKETDKRRNATVWRYIVMARTLDEAKALSVAKQTDHSYTRDDIAVVYGHAMSTLIYGCDNYGERDHTPKPETVPSPEAVAEAAATLKAFEAAHEEPENT